MAETSMNSLLRTNRNPYVARACDRCRRHKSRCDTFRPCSMCVRSKSQCIPSVKRKMTARTSDQPMSEDASDLDVSLQREAVRNRTSAPRDTYSPYPVNRSPQSHNNTVEEAENILFGSDGTSRSESQNLEDREVEEVDAGSAMGIARKIYRLGSQAIDERAINAIPGADARHPGADIQGAAARRPISTFLTHALPQRETMNFLLEAYFTHVHWFSLVIYEPRFRTKLRSLEDGFAKPSDKSFLMLLSTVLGMAAWYTSQIPSADDGRSGEHWKDMSAKLIGNAQSQILELMDQTRLSAVQACILLGSHYLYHGRPNLALSLLGVTTKLAYVMRLHREQKDISFDEAEERKRVWWTIYTWDRFATVTYGRPVGINDKDCNVSMPSDIYENPDFVTSTEKRRNDVICFSSYQRELNRLYMIASPALEALYHCPNNSSRDYPMLVEDITHQLGSWQQQLPFQLVLNMDQDSPTGITRMARAHCLQSLALQLTFDNIIVILHRPFLSQRIDSLRGHVGTPGRLSSQHSFGAEENSEKVFSNLQTSTPGQWWTAAMRASRITELPRMAQLAADSHLVAFLAISLFNSAIVLAVMALSNPLSDEAQAAKRTITRILRLQGLLDKRSTLSMQSSAVLRNVVHLLLRREAEAILTPVPAHTGTADPITSTALSTEHGLLSVEETLNLPLDMVFSADTRPSDHVSKSGPDTVNAASRLNKCLVSVQKAFNTNPNTPWRRPSLVDVETSVDIESTGEMMLQIDHSMSNELSEGFIDPNFDLLYWIWGNTAGLQ